MSERRLVQSIHTREVIPTGLADDSTCYLIALTGDQLEILNTLMNYAHRRINWCDEVVDAGHYYLPNDATWNDIQALVDDLEFRLMDTCELQDLIDALECICTATAALNANQQQAGFGGTLPEEITQYFPYESVPVPTDPQVDETACALAQLTWQEMYEQITEVILPYSKLGFEGALACASALAAAATGGVYLIIGEVLIATGFFALIETAYGAAEKNIINWLFSAKDELICIGYFGWRDGGQQGASDAIEAFIESAEVISFGDKVAAKLALSLALPIARIAEAANSQWAQDNVEPGACDLCEEPGCINFCNAEWTIDPNYGLVDEEACTMTIQGEVTNYVAASCTLEGFHHARVVVDIDPPNSYPPAFYAGIIRLTNAVPATEAQYISCNENGRQEVQLNFALDDPILLEVRTVSGTPTVFYSVCISEAT